jgi:hypothetical protein
MKQILFSIFLLHFTIAYSQNVGIGTMLPLAQLHLKSTDPEVLRLESTNPYLTLYSGANYKGYLWYNGGGIQLGTAMNEPVIISANYNSSPAYFTSNGRLGLGIFNPSEKLDVNGNINLNGAIKINGNSGTAGQVLTSNGGSNPTWTSVTSANNVRFCVQYQAGTGIPTADAMFSTTNYNLNPADVVIGASSITINRSGLYHFDIGINAFISYSAAPTSYPAYSLGLVDGTPFPIPLFSENMATRNSTNTSWSEGEQISYDIYITAPATIRLLLSSISPAFTSRSISGVIMGHLISE